MNHHTGKRTRQDIHGDAPPSRRRAAFGALALLATCLAVAVTSTAAAGAQTASPGSDSDLDGIEDRVETYLGLDPAVADSDGDGVLDRMDIAALSSQQALLVNPTTDTDAEGIPDFLEVYGYYVDGTSIRGQKRLVPTEAWEAFEQREPVGSNPVYLWAATAIEANGYITDATTPGMKLLDIANAYQAIHDEFIDRGLSENHHLVTGSASDTGTIASIMAELVTVYEPAEAIVAGEPQPVYYTDPLLRSSDWDPHSDKQEVLGNFEATTPRSPADHPLIGGIPNISTAVDSFRITEIKEVREVNGETTNHQTVDIDTRTTSHSHGFSVGLELGWEFETGFKGPSSKKTFKASASTTNTWSFANTVGTNTADSYGTIHQTFDINNLNCYSYLQLALDVTNDGTEQASFVKPRWYITIGGELWQTVSSAPYVGNGMNLPVGGSSQVTVLGQPAGQAGCLTLDQTNYLAHGGTIGISTELESAAVPYLDQNTGIINTQGNWADYYPNYEENLARINLDVFTTKGTEIDRTLWVRGFDESDRLPDMRMTIRQALEAAYPPVGCASINQPDASLCLTTAHDGNIVLDEDTSLDFLFFGDDGEQLDFTDSHDAYEALVVDGQDSMDVSLPGRSTVSITDLTSRLPEFGATEVIARTDEATGIDSIEVRASVSDYFGIKSVEFCRSEGDCEEMAYALTLDDSDEAPTYVTDGYFKLELENYTLQGTEFLRARNAVGQEAVQSPRTFYLNLIGTHYDAVLGYDDDLDEKDRWLSYLAAIRLTDASLYQEILGLGMMDDEASLTGTLRTLEASLTGAKEACSFTNPVPHSDPSGLVSQYDDCVQAIAAHEQALVDHPMRIYNPYKVPLRNILTPVDHGMSNSGGGEVTCELPDTAVVTGMEMNYDAGIGASPGIRLYYRTMVQTGLTSSPLTWSSLQSKTCGKMGSVEKHWTDTKNVVSSGELTALVDFGWSVQRGNVSGLCVVTRTFDLDTLAFSSDWDDQCSGRTWGGIEAFSNSSNRKPGASPGPASYGLQDVWLNAKYEAAQGTRARHLTYGFEYQQIPANDLVHEGEYVIRAADGRALTLAGAQAASRQVTLSAFTGAEEQIWVVEAVNDREFRLRPKTYDGYLRRNDASDAAGDQVYAAITATTAETQADHNEHWRLALLGQDDYTISSVVSLRNLSSATVTLTAASPGAANQRWSFEPVTGSVT